MTAETPENSDLEQDRASSLDPKRWVDDHGDYLFRYALMRIGDLSVAEDLVQETFLAAFKGVARFQGLSSERTWLVGILKHKLWDYLGGLKRDPVQADEGPLDQVFDGEDNWRTEFRLSSVEVGPEAILQKRDFWDILERCLLELSPRTRSAFLLREVEGLAHSEVAESLNVSPNNLSVILHRARKFLILCLQKCGILKKEQKD